MPPPSRRLRRRPPGSRVTGSNLAQTFVTVAVAIAAALAALESASAADSWQASVRAEIRASAALLEDVRFVYGDEAPVGLEIALLEMGARSLEEPYAEADRQAALALKGAADPGHLVGGGYDLATGGYDVARRLADERAKRPELTRLNPDDHRVEGDRHGRRALLIVALTIPLVLVYAAVDAVLRRRAARGGPEPPGTVDEVGLVPRPWSVPGRRRFGAAVALTAWLVVTLVPTLQIAFANQEAKNGALASRTAVDVSTALGAGNLVASFRVAGEQRAYALETHALAERLVALDAPGGAAGALSTAARGEEEMARRFRAVARAMGAPPTQDSGLDAVTAAAVNSDPSEADVARVQQNRFAERAAQAGDRENRVVLIILFGGLALSLCALAGTIRGEGSALVEQAAAAVVVLALLAGLSLPFG